MTTSQNLLTSILYGSGVLPSHYTLGAANKKRVVMVVLQDCGTVHMQSLDLEDFDQGLSGQHCNLLRQVKDQDGSVAIICYYPYIF